ncbi:MAG: iron ABC transporter permease [Odoribacteraceae bacterium]|nr:iron ABC transporter permease [Odoribacteraceae bacterium]
MNRSRVSWIVILLSLLALLVASVVAALCVGEVYFTPGEVARRVIAPGDDVTSRVLLQLRLPRVLLGCAVGGALGLSGAILQGVFRNPLVEPYTLGISGGASVGVSLAIVLSLRDAWGGFTLPLAGFAGALVTVLLVQGLGTRRGNRRVESLLLTGVMISFISASLVMLLMATARSEDLHGIIFWIMGALNETDGRLIRLVGVAAVAALLLAYLHAPALNAMRLGMEPARQLGVNTGRHVTTLFLLASLLTGACVSVAGLIGFVGLVVPRLASRVAGGDYRVLLPAAFLGGAAFLVLSDIVARVIIAPLELPIGVITGIAGGVIFIVISRATK